MSLFSCKFCQCFMQEEDVLQCHVVNYHRLPFDSYKTAFAGWQVKIRLSAMDINNKQNIDEVISETRGKDLTTEDISNQSMENKESPDETSEHTDPQEPESFASTLNFLETTSPATRDLRQKAVGVLVMPLMEAGR